MIRGRRREQAGDATWTVDRHPFESPARLRLLVPGWPQFSWGQHARGWVLLGSFAVSLTAAILAWGTWLALCLFAFAFLTHVTSTTDAIRQGSFPVYSSKTAVPIIAGVLAIVFYLPALLMLIATAWPGSSPDRTHSVFLVNCWAYRGAEPCRGHWVWLRLPTLGGVHAGRVVGVAGQEVEWTGQTWLIDGESASLVSPRRITAWPQPCTFRILDHQILIEPEDEGATPPSTGSLLLVSQDQIIGRAWAQYYPVWDRRLL
jgi:hypothetical protein